MKKIISAICVATGLMLIFSAAVNAEDTEMSISFGKAERYDTAIRVPVIVENNIGIQSMCIGVECGSDDVELKAVENNNMFSDAEFSYNISDNGTVITYTDDTYMYYANGVICTLVFTSDDIGNVTNIPLTFIDGSTYVIDKLQDKRGCTVSNSSVPVQQEYNVTYETNGGYVLDNSGSYHISTYPFSYKYEYGERILEWAEREDYTFNGWYEDSELTKRFDGIVRSDITLYASWIPSDRLIEGLTANIYNGKLFADFSVYGENVSDGNMVIVQVNDKDGKVMAIKTQELSLSEKNTQEISVSFDTNTFDSTDLEVSVMLWNPLSKAAPVTKLKSTEAKNAAVITLKGSDNSLISTEYVEIGKSYMPSAPDVEGSSFSGWTNSRGETWSNANIVNGDITLFANYEVNNYTVTYYGETVKTETRAYGAKISQPTGMDGYTIEGWYTADGYKWDFNKDVIKADVNLYSKWTANYYTVTFDTDNADDTVDSQIIKYGGYIEKPTQITKRQYEFTGWYNGDMPWDFTTNKVLDDVTLRAHWAVNEYTVLFETYGGTTVPPVTVNANETIDEPECTKDGYSMFGWYTEEGKRWDFEHNTITEGITLHAEWYDATLDTYLITNEPADTITYNGHKYQRYELKLTWENARDYCRLLGGHLATITDQAEKSGIESLVKNGIDKRFYLLGASDAESEGKWRWITGEDWSYTAWSDKEPSNKSGIDGSAENYLSIYQNNALFNDVNNNETNVGFICEFENIDDEAPSITNIKIIDQDLTGYTVQCRVKDNSENIKKVQFPTWTLGNGQDDLVLPWKPNEKIVGQKEKDIYTFRVNISEHNNEYGAYETRIYAFDGQNNKNDMGSISVNVIILPEPVKTIYYNKHVYELYNVKSTWSAALYTCDKLGGTIPAVTTAEEQEKIYGLAKMLNSNLWIGASDSEKEGTWKWSDDTVWGYTNWASGEPNDTDSNEDYALMYITDGSWNDVSGTTKTSAFVCEYVNPKPIVETVRDGYIYAAFKYDLSDEDIVAFCEARGGTRVDVDPDISPDAVFAYKINLDMEPSCEITYNGHRYLKYDNNLTWHDAKYVCEAMGGHLATITSAAENTAVRNMISGSSADCWLGGTDEFIEGQWEWITGENITYTNWRSSTSEPNNSGDEDYMTIALGTGEGVWNDLSSATLRGFICEIE